MGNKKDWQRTVECGALRSAQVGETVTVNGWANSVRDHGGVTFIDLRDRTGLVQIVVDPTRNATSEEAHLAAQTVRSEFCLSIRGTVSARVPGAENPNLATGEIEIKAARIEILNPCRTLPFQIDQDQAGTNEELRLKYRYLDLRRPSMYEKLRLRHEAVRLIRAALYEQGFLEIETPILTKGTPEGAREYLVPYRLQPGLFYVLPQAPQQFKQLLMVSGVERYFQIAKCFRDEAQRADRQPEFTQLDLEMSFATQEDILNLVEALMVQVIEALSEKQIPQPFVRLTYDEAMARYGSDKPDLRFGLELVDCAHILQNTGFAVFQNILSSGGQVKAIRYPGGAKLARSQMDELVTLSKEFGAKGLAYFLVDDEGNASRGPVAKFLSNEEKAAIVAAASAEPGDLVGFIADTPATTAKVLDRLRRLIGERLGLADRNTLACCWITDFPVFEKDEETGGWTYAHNPFSMPNEGHMALIDTDPEAMRAQTYDLVCNGVEWASGSVRIHKPDIQTAILRKLGLDDAQIEARFGHMLQAFEHGAPPHAGIAPGLDRLVMFLTDDENIREVIAFPKMGGGFDPLMNAPSPIEAYQLAELGLQITPKPDGEKKV
ncbi:MAG: aspartate--tRNA ligase [Cytophagales bacterium]|nr:aspartate--tRNA ligase [Armatimonadota bacterium]